MSMGTARAPNPALGESETVIPRQVGINRFVLREPIPLGFRYMYGIIQPQERKVLHRVGAHLGWTTAQVDDLIRGASGV